MKLLRKAITYVDKKYVKKYIDNKYWQLADNLDNKVHAPLHETLLDELSSFYPEIDLEREKTANPAHYKFLIHKFTKYVYLVKQCLVNPEYSWVMLGGNKIFRYSYPLIEDPWDAVKPRPSVIGSMFKRKPVEIEKGILIKYSWHSYYHFFCDTLPQLLLCTDAGIPDSVPLIVPQGFDSALFTTEYFKEFPLNRKIIVQEKGQYFNVKELYVAKDICCSGYLPAIKQAVISKNIAGLSPGIDSYPLIFVTRKNIRRSLFNAEEIEGIAKEYGFTVVDPGNYNWLQQVKLFSAAEKIIGVHGAALTNILFCKTPDLNLLELMPGKDLNPEHYQNMSLRLGYQYSMLKGNGLDSNYRFSVDKEAFRDAVKKLVAT